MSNYKLTPFHKLTSFAILVSFLGPMTPYTFAARDQETEGVAAVPVALAEPPPDCSTPVLIVRNPRNLSESMEVRFCEWSTPGLGELWLRSNSTVAHVVKVLPDPGVENLAPMAFIAWGPKHWFQIGTAVHVRPGERIRIRATRFGNGKEWQAATLANINLMGELLFEGNTPPPGLDKAKAVLRYGTNLPGTDALVVVKCLDGFANGSSGELRDCLWEIAQSDAVAQIIAGLAAEWGGTLALWQIQGLFNAFTVLKNIGLVIGLLREASDIYQDVEFYVFNPQTPDPVPPPPTCLVCVDSAEFVKDVTIPDGMSVSPGQSLIKTWRLRNTSATSWGSGYQLVFVNGEQMGTPSAISVPFTPPGQTVDISVNFTAPSTQSLHSTYWQLRKPSGIYFGPKIWIKVNVITSSGQVSVSADPPSASASAPMSLHART